MSSSSKTLGSFPPAPFPAWLATCRTFAKSSASGAGLIALVGESGSGKSYTLTAISSAASGLKAGLRTVDQPIEPGIDLDLVDDVDEQSLAGLAEPGSFQATRALAIKPALLDLLVSIRPDVRVVHVRPMSSRDVRAMIEVRRIQLEVPVGGFTLRALTRLDELCGGNPRRLDELLLQSYHLYIEHQSLRIADQHVEHAAQRLAAGTTGRPKKMPRLRLQFPSIPLPMDAVLPGARDGSLDMAEILSSIRSRPQAGTFDSARMANAAMAPDQAAGFHARGQNVAFPTVRSAAPVVRPGLDPHWSHAAPFQHATATAPNRRMLPWIAGVAAVTVGIVALPLAIPELLSIANERRADRLDEAIAAASIGEPIGDWTRPLPVDRARIGQTTLQTDSDGAGRSTVRPDIPPVRVPAVALAEPSEPVKLAATAPAGRVAESSAPMLPSTPHDALLAAPDGPADPVAAPIGAVPALQPAPRHSPAASTTARPSPASDVSAASASTPRTTADRGRNDPLRSASPPYGDEPAASERGLGTPDRRVAKADQVAEAARLLSVGKALFAINQVVDALEIIGAAAQLGNPEAAKILADYGAKRRSPEAGNAPRRPAKPRS